MDAFINAIKRVVSDMIGGIPQPRFATVTAFDPATHSVKLLIQPEGLATGWTPMHAVAVGKGIGFVIPPNIGDQVSVMPKEGDADNYVVTGRFFHDDASTPVSSVTGKALDSGEAGLFGPNGSFLHLGLDGVFNFKGDVIIDGNLVVKKDISDKDSVHGTLDLLRTDYNEHKHTNVQNGGGQSGTTTKPTP